MAGFGMLLLQVLLPYLGAAAGSAISPAAFHALRDSLHTLPPAEAKARVLSFDGGAAPPPHQDKIDHFVVLFMENHAMDNYFGCNTDLAARGADIGLLHSQVGFKCGTSYGFVCRGGPGYDTFAGKFGPGQDPTTYPYGNQSDAFSAAHGASGIALEGFDPEQLTIKSAIADHFGVFNRMYTAVPSASTPNHLFAQSATSCGIHDNIMYSACGGKTNTFPQMTIYDSLRVNNVDFGLWMNSSCGTGPSSSPCHGVDPNTPNAGSPIPSPDVAMSGVSRHVDRFFSQQHFYERAANGTLPAFNWVMPPMEACDHPCQDVAKGERLLKDVYEALRAGPGWNKTLLFVTYDDAGGYYDHVVPPFEGVPNDDAPCHVQDQCGSSRKKFDFRRLGLRSAAMLISPWVAKGAVFQEPQAGPFNTSQFDHTSLLSTAKSLFNLTGFLPVGLFIHLCMYKLRLCKQWMHGNRTCWTCVSECLRRAFWRMCFLISTIPQDAARPVGRQLRGASAQRAAGRHPDAPA